MAKNFSKVYSIQTTGLSAQTINIEADITENKNFSSFTVVGLPDKAIEEARDRVNAAVKNSGFSAPKSGSGRTIVSLAPADVKKEGPLFDLGVALGYLLASEQISFNPDKKIFLGELSLDGRLRPTRGVLVLVREAQKRGFQEIYLPKENTREAALIKGIQVYGVSSLSEVVEHLNIAPDKNGAKGRNITLTSCEPTRIEQEHIEAVVDFCDVRGQESVKRGLEIAAAGGHNVAMYGPPGTGKTMLARAFSGILPPLEYEDVLEVTGIHSVAGALNADLITSPPFRSPHHTSSYVSIVGGGAFPKPGEITLAHKGVLFMDEFPEFEKRVIESLRQPLEDRVVNISRAKGTERFPANFILVAALNPCPCGNFGSEKTCTCTQMQLSNYQKKLSGPIVDRIDLWLHVGAIDHEKLAQINEGKETSLDVRKRVIEARSAQKNRLKNSSSATNSEMSARDIEKDVKIDEDATQILLSAAKHINISPRAYHKIIKVARTIADLSKEEFVKKEHILEALNYRPKELY